MEMRSKILFENKMSFLFYLLLETVTNNKS